MRFGLLSYATANLGDDIQSLAAERFLPKVDLLINRETLDRDQGGADEIAIILSGWYMANPWRWPPHPLIRPLLVSMHISAVRRSRKRFWIPSPAWAMLRRKGRKWLQTHGPVGARDTATLELLQSHDISAWYSGCLTLTLPRYEGKRLDRIIACDLPDVIVKALRDRTRTPIECVSHAHTDLQDHAARRAKACHLLSLYASAQAVVTSRVHCALPCLALGTPVLFVPLAPDQARLQPALDLTHTATPASIIAGAAGFDLDDPPPNSNAFLALAEPLAAKCKAYFGAISGAEKTAP